MNFNDYLNEIQKCIDNKLFIASLTMSLILPDLCGSIEYPNEKPSSRYKKWYHENIGDFHEHAQDRIQDSEKMPWPSSDVVYSLRNNMFHVGIPNLNKNSIHQEENIINKFYLDFSESCLLSTAEVECDNLGKKIISYRINAKMLSIMLLNCTKSFYKENKEVIDSNYITIKDGFGDMYLWTK